MFAHCLVNWYSWILRLRDGYFSLMWYLENFSHGPQTSARAPSRCLLPGFYVTVQAHRLPLQAQESELCSLLWPFGFPQKILKERFTPIGFSWLLALRWCLEPFLIRNYLTPFRWLQTPWPPFAAQPAPPIKSLAGSGLAVLSEENILENRRDAEWAKKRGF